VQVFDYSSLLQPCIWRTSWLRWYVSFKFININPKFKVFCYSKDSNNWTQVYQLHRRCSKQHHTLYNPCHTTMPVKSALLITSKFLLFTYIL